jgi:hypothetical protein
MSKSLISGHSYSRRHLALFILVAIMGIATAVGMIVHHHDIGWFVMPVWAFVLIGWVNRALKQWAKGIKAKS